MSALVEPAGTLHMPQACMQNNVYKTKNNLWVTGDNLKTIEIGNGKTFRFVTDTITLYSDFDVLSFRYNFSLNKTPAKLRDIFR